MGWQSGAPRQRGGGPDTRQGRSVLSCNVVIQVLHEVLVFVVFEIIVEIDA